MDNEKYIFSNVSEVVSQLSPDYGFFISSPLKKGDEGHEKASHVWVPVTVHEARIMKEASEPKAVYSLQVFFTMNGLPHNRTFKIPAKGYMRFLTCKTLRKRIEILTELLQDADSELRLRKYPAEKRINLKVTSRLYHEVMAASKKCGKNLSQYCIGILNGKQPHTAFSEEERAMMDDLRRLRSNLQLMENAIFSTLKGLPKEKLFKMVIEGKEFAWWRNYLIESKNIIDEFIKSKQST